MIKDNHTNSAYIYVNTHVNNMMLSRKLFSYIISYYIIEPLVEKLSTRILGIQ